MGDGKKAMANCSSHWGAGPWRDFPSNWVVDVDGDSSFDWGKTLGPSKPVFLGIKCSLPWSLGSIILSSYLWHDLFLNSHNVRLRHLFSIKSFTGKRTAPNKCSGPWRSDASSRFRVHEKFFPPVAGLRQKPITIFGFVVTSKMRTKKSRNNLESAGECYDGQPEAISVPHLFTACLRGLVFQWCFQWTSNCINTFYAHLCNCRGLPWRGNFKMTGKRKAGGRCCAGSSLRAPADAEHLVAIENSPKKKTACCFAWGCFLTHLPISDFQATPIFLKERGAVGPNALQQERVTTFAACWGSLVFLAKAWSLS